MPVAEVQVKGYLLPFINKLLISITTVLVNGKTNIVEKKNKHFMLFAILFQGLKAGKCGLRFFQALFVSI